MSSEEVKQLTREQLPTLEDIGEMEASSVGSVKRMSDFYSEVEYINYMQEACEPRSLATNDIDYLMESGVVVRASSDYEQVKKGDLGLYLQHNKNYPPVQIRWLKFGHKYWLYWRDLELVAEDEAKSVRAQIKEDVKYELELQQSMRAGAKVMMTRSYQCIAQGDIGEYMQHNDRYPPCQVKWLNFGDPYWVFWRDIIPIDGLSEDEILQLKHKHRPEFLKGESKFNSESDFVEYMANHVKDAEPGKLRVIATTSSGHIRPGDTGYYLQTNTSYPPCLIEWAGKGKKWVYWRDIRFA